MYAHVFAKSILLYLGKYVLNEKLVKVLLSLRYAKKAIQILILVLKR